jgi:hypothetical protein
MATATFVILRRVALGVVLLCSAPACGKDATHEVVGKDSSGQSAHNDPGGSATETNVAGIHCYKDGDCGGHGRTCVPNPGQDDGACSAAPGDDDAGVATRPNTR